MHIHKKHLFQIVGSIVVLAILLTVGLPYGDFSWTALAQYGVVSTGTGTTIIDTAGSLATGRAQLRSNGTLRLCIGTVCVTFDPDDLDTGVAAGQLVTTVNIPGEGLVNFYYAGIDPSTGAAIYELRFYDDDGVLLGTINVYVLPDGSVALGS